MLSGFLEGLHNSPVKNPEVIYWSYSQSQQKVWDKLKEARAEFGERSQESSEPDLIIKSEDVLFLIEAKLTASNKIDFGNYLLKKSVEDTIDAGYYQLMRFWMIGSSIAKRLNLDFCLVNLVLSGKEESIEQDFKKYVKENQRRKFMRITWEDVYKYILDGDLLGADWDMIIRYFRNKTIGYDKSGELQRAFSIS